jgi:predicted transglutaminase-like cysteine proteinase
MKVNSFFNQWPYKFDRPLWGVEDYWATPCEFMIRSGDCEDYAIAKYYALRELGVPASQMRIAAIRNAMTGNGHAVLVLYVNDDAYVLDNVTNTILSHKRLGHYRPLYTVNEEYMWRHVRPITKSASKDMTRDN